MYSYVWGLDLSGTLQGAGGVGGLVARIQHTASGTNLNLNNGVYYASDANGNVTGYVYWYHLGACYQFKYDPYGNILSPLSPSLRDHKFRFSSKYCDDETGLYYYGYYSPELGRFVSADPLAQVYPRPVYRFVENDPINDRDLFGLMSDAGCQRSVDRFMANPGSYSSALKQVLDAIGDIEGCQPLKPKCKCCTGDAADWLGYVSGDGTELFICSNNMDDNDAGNPTQKMLETLVHENLHVLQGCRGQDDQSCDGAVCAEIQAALHDGTCQRLFPGNVRQCVIDTAASAAQNRCPSRNEAEQRASAL